MNIQLIPEKDLHDFITIVANAYPRMKLSTPEERDRTRSLLLKLQNEEPTTHIYGFYEDGTLRGGMILYDFTMTMFSVPVLVGGVGLVAVDLIHKREKVCKEMISFFLDYYKKKGSFLTSLYPFRPDFYKEMGFGFGTKMHQYRLHPEQLPARTKEHIHFLSKKDTAALVDCYNRYAATTHGMMKLTSERKVERIMEDPLTRIVGYKTGNSIQGYLVFMFKEAETENFVINDIRVREFIYETTEAFWELLTFLHSQKDQIRYCMINTQDEYFHHVLDDPRYGEDMLMPHIYHETDRDGIGLMYRIIDVKRAFEVLKDHNFGGIDCRLRIDIQDGFFPENQGSYIVHFEEGIPQLGRNDFEVSIHLKISDFTSLIMGIVPFDRLCTYGLAEISDSGYVDVVTRLFAWAEKPVCTTEF
ncbi:MAG: GNAT family N-acetyltransferase [Theionarchaea archaeon]|nr:GNAT family N-acetyltransferase [Theionarchaea archaeon]MBU7037911.1 GNAT family N-acetyltransferase [Theionarchaea archaeon]